jgi:ElaB/YqjD/DUF883 family membrane-anchored ribosome-binding protein
MNNATPSRTDSQKDAATLEREIDQTRAQMDQTLGALERKFSPGEFLDQTLNLVRQHGGELATNVNTVIKENPMPALLTAAGIVWMLVSSNRPKTSLKARTVDYEYDPPAEEYGRSESKSHEDEPGVLAQAGQRIKSGAEATRQKLTSSGEAVSSGFNRTAETAQAQAARVRDGFNSLLEEQPLVLGALGIALGAAIGAALPITEQEDRLLGSARDQTMNKIKETGSESFKQVKESVTRVGEEAKQAVSQTLGRASENDPNRGARGMEDKA